jgi:hypothetical protein
VRGAGAALALTAGGVNWTGPAVAGAGAGTGAAAAAGGVGAGDAGIGSGQIGSTAGWPDGFVAATLGLGTGGDFRPCLDGCPFGLAAAAAATPGKTGPFGSGFMMLTAGIEAALGKSMLTTFLGWPAVEPVAAGGASATGTSDPVVQAGA